MIGKMFVKTLVLVAVLNVIAGYSISKGRVENINTFIQTSVPLTFQYLGSSRDNIIAYSTDIKHFDVHVSNDGGLTFTNKLDQFLIKSNDTDTKIPAKLHAIYVSPNGQNVVFTDIWYDKLFISMNFGQDFKLKSVNFKPSLVQFYGDNDQFVVFDEIHKTLHYTNKSDGNFYLLTDNVTSFEWQTKNGLKQNLFFGNKSSIFVFNGSDQTVMEWKNFSWIINYRQFQVFGHFVFVLTSQNEIYFIYKNGSPIQVQLYPYFACKRFHVADIEEKSIKLAVMHKSETRLYVGNFRRTDVIKMKFVLSLKNIVSHIPETTWSSALFRIKKPFTELYNVAGFSGVYIANVHCLRLYSNLDHFSISDIRTVTTLDNGVTWKPFDAHFYDPTENFIDCATQCRLKLSSKLFDSIGFHHYPGIKSNKNVLGLVIASGVGQSISNPLSTRPYNFLSNDMGKTWQKILDGYYNLNIGNRGGIIVAVKTLGITNELLYSLNYGGTWNAYIFCDREITVVDLFTSDSLNSTKFQLTGYDGVNRRQMFVTLDFKNIFVPNCKENSTKMISRIEDKIFGKVIILEENVGRNCLNFKVIQKVNTTIQCGNADYECGAGYFRNNLTSNVCYPEKVECKTESFYTTGELQKVANKNCFALEIVKHRNITCPITGEENFILIANDTRVHQLDLYNNTTSLLVQAKSAIRAIDFDINTKCLFYTEFGSGQIKRKCHDSLEELLVIPDSDTWFRSLTYDDEYNVLYYLDARIKKVFAVQTSKLNWGRRIIINDLLLADPYFVYVNPVEQIIYVRDGEQIKRGNIIHVNGEISVQNFVLEILPFELKTGDTFTLSEKNTQIIVNNWYTHANGNIFKKTYTNKTLATGFTSVHDMQFVNMRDVKSSNQWSCTSGEKIARRMVCDGHFDCMHGDDESSCEIKYQPEKFYSSLPV